MNYVHIVYLSLPSCLFLFEHFKRDTSHCVCSDLGLGAVTPEAVLMKKYANTDFAKKRKHRFWCKSITLQASRFFLNSRVSSTIRLLHKSLGNKACYNVPSYFPSPRCPLKA